MADNIFNPEVQPVGIPDSIGATKPISRPIADESKGKLFEGIGKGLTEAGDIVKEATKLTDFTNKEDLNNKISIDLNATRDRRITSLEDEDHALVQGAAVEGGKAPIGLQGLPGQVNRYAAAKVQGKLDDVSFRGRVNDLAKQYRATYPGYRDYIDHVFQKAGFGNPANEYMTSLERANLGIQQQLSANKSKTLDLLYKDGDKIKNAGGLIDDLTSGRKSESEVNAIVFPQLKTHYDMKTRQEQFGLEAADSKNREEQAEKLVTDNISQHVATALNSPAVKAIRARMEGWATDPKSINEPQAEADANYLSQVMIGIRVDAQRRDTDSHTFKTVDAEGNIIDTTQTYANNSILKTKYPDVVDKALDPLNSITNRLQKKDTGYAGATARIVAASHDEYAKKVFGGDYGEVWQAAKFAESTGPQWWKNFVGIQMANTNSKFLTEGMKGLTQGVTWPMFAPNPPSAAQQIQKVTQAGVNNPEVNKAILNTAPQVITDKAAPPAVKANVATSFFGSTNPSILDNMKIDDKVKQFSAMTSKDMVHNIATLPEVHKDQYVNWVTTEFSKNLGADLGTLPASVTGGEGTWSGKLKITWNDKTNSFGVDIPGNKNVQNMDLNRIPWSKVQGVRSGYSNSGEVKNLVERVKRINTGLEGLKNLATESKLDVNAYLIHTMSNTGLTDNKFWDAVKAQEGSKIVPTKEVKKDQDRP